jgi:alpha-L-rhamnosidase
VAHALCYDKGLVRAGPYFSYYVCRALHQIGAGSRLVDRLRTWQTFLDVGLKTFPEHGVLSRSDCHAWNAHPLFHMLTGILGVGPGSMGFESVIIEPHLGDLRQAAGSVPHPLGDIRVSLRAADRVLDATVELPLGLSGQLRWGGQTVPLHAGTQQLVLDRAE